MALSLPLRYGKGSLCSQVYNRPSIDSKGEFLERKEAIKDTLHSLGLLKPPASKINKSDFQTNKLLNGISFVIFKHLLNRIRWNADYNSNTHENINCKYLLRRLSAIGGVFELSPIATRFAVLDDESTDPSQQHPNSLLDSQIREYLTDWVYSLTKASRPTDGTPNDVNRMYGYTEREIYNQATNDLTNVREYTLWRGYPFGINLSDPIRITVVNGLPWSVRWSARNGEIDAGVALYFSGQKYIVSKCGRPGPIGYPLLRLDGSCNIIDVIYSPVRQYSYFDAASITIGLRVLIGVERVRFRGQWMDDGLADTAWILEISDVTNKGDAWFRAWRISGPADSCSLRSESGQDLMSPRELFQ